jgi:hypothetical protein
MEEPALPDFKLILPYFELILPGKAASQAKVLKAQIDFVQRGGKKLFSFTILPADLIEDLTGDFVAQQALRNYLIYLFQGGEIPPERERRALLTAWQISRLLDCSEEMCQRTANLAEAYLQHAGAEDLPALELILQVLSFAPTLVARFLKDMANRIYETDSFTNQLAHYFREIIQHNEQMAYALQPHAYPTVHAERIDRISPTFFLLDPLRSSALIPDYMDAQPVAAIPEGSFIVAPTAVKLPDIQLFLQRAVQIFPDLLQFNEEISAQIRQQFPGQNVGFLIADMIMPICLDEWLFQRFSDKANIEIHAYGPTIEIREKIFTLINTWFRVKFGFAGRRFDVEPEYMIRQGRAGLVFSRANPNLPALIIRIVPSGASTAMQQLSQQRVSHLQVGYDMYKGLVCTPLFSLYFRQRVSVIDHYAITFEELVTTLYYGFTLSIIAPFAHLLVYLKANKFKLTHLYYEVMGMPALIKGAPQLVVMKTPPVGTLWPPIIQPADATVNRHANWLAGQSGDYAIIGSDAIVVSKHLDRWDTISQFDALESISFDLDINRLIEPGEPTTIEGVTNTPQAFHYDPERPLAKTLLEMKVGSLMLGNYSLGSSFLLRQCRFKRLPQYLMPREVRVMNKNYKLIHEYVWDVGVTLPERTVPPMQIDTVAAWGPQGLELQHDVVRYEGTGPVAGPGRNPVSVFERVNMPNDPTNVMLLNSTTLFPINVVGVLQIHSQGGRRPVSISEMRDPLPLTEEQINALPVIKLDQLFDFLLVADPEFHAQVLAYREVNQGGAIGYWQARNVNVMGKTFRHERVPQDIPRLYEAALAKYRPITLQQALYVPQFVRVDLDVTIGSWLFIDEGDWLMPFSDLFKYEFNCTIKRSTASDFRIGRGYKIFP